MKVSTKWFGQIEVEDSKVITFERGLIGFDQYNKYVIVNSSEDPDSDTIMWLQSVDERDIAIPIIKPQLFLPDYNPIIEDSLLEQLGEIKEDKVLVLFVTITVPSEITKMTCNLKAPIIVHINTMRGCQLIADNKDYTVKYPIYERIKKETQN